MHAEQWVTEISSRWPYRNNRTEEELSAINSDLYDFALNKSPKLLDEILGEFRKMKAPKGFGMWWFWQQLPDSDRGVWWRQCLNGHLYRDIGSGCPLCGSKVFSLHKGDSMTSETILIQASCCNCQFYEESRTQNKSGVYGDSCKEYGTERRGKENICKDCRCRECCEMAYLFYNNPGEYRRRYGDYIDSKFKEVLGILDGKG